MSQSPALVPSPTVAAAGHPLSAADLLAQARASAAAGAGPWGPVAASSAAVPLSSGPNLTFGVIMTYDAADGYVLAVSLNASSGPFNNSYGPSDLTWKFAGGNWSLVPTVGQVPATLSPGLVYDAHDQYVLLYGGRLMGTGASVAPVTNQTWSYHAGVWTNLSATSTAAPFAVDFANLVYDAADEYVLLYNEIGITTSTNPNGSTNPNEYLNTTWTYVAGVWTNITATAGTPPQMLGAMTYDAADGYVVYFGGYTWWDELTNATWTFQAGNWTNISSAVVNAPSPRMNFGIDYDSARGAVVLYGGLAQLYVSNGSAFSYETWAYSSGTWTRLSSNGTVWNIQSMTYDPADNESVLLGANSSLAGPPNVVTWAFSAGAWVVAAPLFLHRQATADVGHAFALTVTQSPNAGGVTYHYQGLPAGCDGTAGPVVTCVPTTAGTLLVSVVVSGSAGFQATATATVVVNPAPTVVDFSGGGPIGEVGISTTFQATAEFGTGNLTYAYADLPPGCATANTPEIQCVPSAAGTFDVSATITDALGVTATASTGIQVVPPLSVAGVTINRTATDVGQPISITGTASGGDGPLLYLYAGLPPGCSSAEASAVTCRPGATGTYPVIFGVRDALGASAQGESTVQVNPLPSVASVVLSNRTPVAGGGLSITTTIVGGTAPFAFGYAGLPWGCAPSTGAAVQCTAVLAGNYSVVVTVTDAVGVTAVGTVTVDVLSTPGSVEPPTRTAAELGFWWGFALAGVAIAAVAIVGARRLYLTRQGEAMARVLSTPVEPGPESTREDRRGPGGPVGRDR